MEFVLPAIRYFLKQLNLNIIKYVLMWWNVGKQAQEVKRNEFLYVQDVEKHEQNLLFSVLFM